MKCCDYCPWTLILTILVSVSIKDQLGRALSKSSSLIKIILKNAEHQVKGGFVCQFQRIELDYNQAILIILKMRLFFLYHLDVQEVCVCVCVCVCERERERERERE
jgi:hypothetical protein